MPTRDAGRTLRPAVDSILGQTLDTWELIVVDDGSRDDTREILSGYASRDDRIRVLHAADPGLVAALNQGITVAQSELIARMDADDVSHPERLERQLGHLEHHPDIGLVGCQVRFGGDRHHAAGYAIHVDWLNSVIHPDAIALNRFVESPFAHPSVVFRKSLVERHGGYADGPFPEDYELWLRWLDAGVRMAKVRETLFTWSDSPDRLSRSDRRYSTDAFYGLKAVFLARAVRRTLRQRPLWIWGAGRPTRKRAERLCQHGVAIAGYIDVDPAKSGRNLRGRPVRGADELPSPRDATVLGYVASRGARDLIRQRLVEEKFVEGRDFWMAA